MAEIETAPRGQDCIAAALAFVVAGWADQAVALGWDEIALFGVCPVRPGNAWTDRGQPIHRFSFWQ